MLRIADESGELSGRGRVLCEGSYGMANSSDKISEYSAKEQLLPNLGSSGGHASAVKNSSLLARLSFLLMRLLSPGVSFIACGVCGFLAALTLSLFLVINTQLSPWTILLCAAIAVAGLLGTALTIKVLTGEDSFVFYRDAITAMALVAVVLGMLHLPVLRYLDVTILGAGLFTACGRIGCSSVGCCHGRPSRWGICYGLKHAESGFPPHYVGVRLFPIQAVESLFVLCLVAVGTAIVWKSAPPGTVLAFYFAAYAVGRFFIEFARGDAERPFLWNFSEAQWISVLLLWAIVFAERAHILPSVWWHLYAAISLLLSMAGIAAKRRLDRRHRFELLHPYHVRELAQAITQILELPLLSGMTESKATNLPPVSLFRTSRGIQLSGGCLGKVSPATQHFCLSRKGDVLTQREAASLALTIARLSRASASMRLIGGGPGVFHLLLPLQRFALW